MFYVLLVSFLILNPVHAFAGHRLSMVVSSDSLRKAAAATKQPSEKQSSGRIPSQPRRSLNRDGERMAWINRSVEYYTKVMREERRRNMGQLTLEEGPEQREEFIDLAKKHYFARYKIKNGMPRHAEQIYRRIIDELSHEEEGLCDHAKLAVTTLLLALLLQRQGDMKGTRSVFLSFFRIAVLEMDEDKECACSAKVLQAYALFEMKRGNSLKSLELATKAIKLDSSLASIMQWKQFRDAKESRETFMARAAIAATA
jgi:hypothetical protein